MTILIAYATSEGQTARVAEYLGVVARRGGHAVDVVDVGRTHGVDPAEYDAVIVGAPVRRLKHARAVREFVRKHRAALERMPAAFFSVSVAAQGESAEARAEVDGYIAEFVGDTGWHPATVGRFAGALMYTKYDFITRFIMRRIARRKGSRDLDTSRDYVYTDWTLVRRFGDEFLGVAGRATMRSDVTSAGEDVPGQVERVSWKGVR